jgi:cysteine synthase A
MARFDNILETIGNTPLVRLQRLGPKGVDIYVKVESFNPMGSVKDRMARAIIESAEASGELAPGQTVIEATSGNTGIGLAMVCAQKGYPLVVTMPESASIERRKIMRFLGAKVVLTPASEKGTGMLTKAIELAEKHGYYLTRQFENEANAEVHSRTTAMEILRDLGDLPLDYFVSGFGTGGTLLGTARRLKQVRPDTRVVAAEPDNAQMVGSRIPQPRAADGSPSGSHPNFRPHLMQGWSPDFVPDLTQEAIDRQLIDEVVPVAGSEAIELCLALARKEGIFAGTSSGATLAAALGIAKRSAPGTSIVCMLPDTAERYMSTPLFDGISADMTSDEITLSDSTPSCRFEIAAPAVVASEARVPRTASRELDRNAVTFVDEVVGDEPVVMFALEWCEFSWSVRKLFQAMDVEYRGIDLDSVDYQAGDFGGEIRRVLHERLGSPTIPQIFVGGQHLGGATDVLEAARTGRMQALLEAAGASFDDLGYLDPYDLLPQWVQPRKSA